MASNETYGNQDSQTIIDFLKANVPKSDIPNIELELKKDFHLAKKKGKGKQRKKPRKAHGLTRREKKSLGFYTIPRNGVRYEDMIPLHEKWLVYMTQVLGTENIPDFTNKCWEQFTQTIFKADFHGSMLHVVRSKCPSFVGKKGICIMDTKNTFKIVSKDNIVTTIPKSENFFEMHIKNIKIQFFGKHLCIRPAERSTKKVKCQLHPDL